MTSYGSNIFAGTYNNDLFFCRNNGFTWYGIPTGLTDHIIKAITVSGQKVFASALGNGVYLNSQILANSPELNNSKDETFIYPNPANEYFSIKTNSELDNVTFEIYNLIGELVYSEYFQGSLKFISRKISVKLPSGIYFAKLFNGEKQFIEKLNIENN